ncbi:MULTISPECIES: hypothetical protein [unclassified Variovorax]|uniref:hypothetical protein n=1 Tax=unclassified Variovorax TaxID=663243 RepID=UPI003F470BF4
MLPRKKQIRQRSSRKQIVQERELCDLCTPFTDAMRARVLSRHALQVMRLSQTRKGAIWCWAGPTHGVRGHAVTREAEQFLQGAHRVLDALEQGENGLQHTKIKLIACDKNEKI